MSNSEAPKVIVGYDPTTGESVYGEGTSPSVKSSSQAGLQAVKFALGELSPELNGDHPEKNKKKTQELER